VTIHLSQGSEQWQPEATRNKEMFKKDSWFNIRVISEKYIVELGDNI